MKAFRLILIVALTAAVLLAICAPALLQSILPDNVQISWNFPRSLLRIFMVPLLKADTCWMGLILEEGDHDIRLTYRTEMLRTGALCSVAGLLLLLFGWTFFYHKKHRGKKHD